MNRKHAHSRRSSFLETLESRRLLFADAFLSHEIDCCVPRDVEAVEFADVDGDGNTDLIAGSRQGARWYSNASGNGDYRDERLLRIDEAFDSYTGLASGDFNRDGFADFVVAHSGAFVIYTGSGDSHPQRTSEFQLEDLYLYDHVPMGVQIVDLDGDGDSDIVGHGEVIDFDKGETYDSVVWFENQDGRGHFSDYKSLVNDLPVTNLQMTDVDGDGDFDMIRHSVRDFDDDTISWYENFGQGNFGPSQRIANASHADSFTTDDFDNDGDIDILVEGQSRISLATFQNGMFTELVDAGSLIDFYPTDIDATDVDGDGRIDLVFVQRGIGWLPNRGDGTFGTQRYLSDDSGGNVFVRDIDSDGDVDILAGGNGVSDLMALENLANNGTFRERRLIDSTDGQQGLVAADIDGDGDQDLVSAADASGDRVAWYENLGEQDDGSVRYSEVKTIGDDANEIYAFQVGDVDGDADLDVLVSSRADDRILVYRNDGSGRFGQAETVTDTTVSVRDLKLVDIDNDNDLDIVSTSANANGETFNLAWHENTNGTGEFAVPKLVSDTLQWTVDLATVDVDSDGDVDLLVSTRSNNTIRHFENTDAAGTFAEQQPIRYLGTNVLSFVAADLDNDGDLDLAVSSYDVTVPDHNYLLSKLENANGVFSAVLIDEDRTRDYGKLHANDFDADGDLDLISASPWQDRIRWFVNGDQPGHFEEGSTVASGLTGVANITIADFDNDGKLDVASASSHDGSIAWHERRLVGDVNDDGKFDSSDLVLLFQSGHYEDSVENNSTFLEGDWNGDGEFNSADLVYVFQLGIYVK